MARKKTSEELMLEAKKKMDKARRVEQKENAAYGIKLRNMAKQLNQSPEELLTIISKEFPELSTSFANSNADDNSEKQELIKK